MALRKLTLCLLLAAPVLGAPQLPKIGVAGELRMGLGGVLVRAGLPFDYLTATEESRPEALAGYDLILAAALDDSDDFQSAALAAFDKYVRGGGHLYCELGWRLPGALGPVGFDWRGESRGAITFSTVDGQHPFLAELGATRNWLYRATIQRVQVNDPSVTVLARFDRGWLRNAPALLARKWGQGEVLFTPTEIGYRQGNWEPIYEELFRSIIAYLSGGKARPQWADPQPAPRPAEAVTAVAAPEADYPKLGQADDLGPAPADGYFVRVPLKAEAVAPAQVILEYQPAPKAGLLLNAGARHAELSLLNGRRPLRVDYPAGTVELLVQRLPDRANLLLDGRLLGTLPAPPPRAGLGCFGRGCEPLVQPTEPVFFSDDFTGEGNLSGVWSPSSGQWSLSGQTPAVARVPGFSLRGGSGAIAAGSWFWSRYRAEVSVQPSSAKTIVLQAACWDARNRVELRCPVGEGQPALVRLRDGVEQVLATGGAALPARQWSRLSLTVADGRAVGSVDGVGLLTAATDAGAGGFGLGALGGDAVFDDVRVSEAEEAPSLPRVHPVEYDKGPGGLLDRDTWASPAAAWVPTRAPQTFWHVGRFAGDLRLAIPLHQPSATARLTVHAGPERGVSAPVLVVVGAHDRIELVRTRGQFSASVDGQPVPVLAQPTGSLCLGLEWSEQALVASEVELAAADVHEYLFDKAPADWRESGGDWSIMSRWSCNPQWSWLCGSDNDHSAALWFKRPVTGDLVVQAPVGPLMHGNYAPGCEDFARLRVSICADGRDPWSGYCFELGERGKDVCTLYRAHQPVAKVEHRLPRWREIHNAWFDIRLERHGAALDVTYHGRPLLHWVDPTPLGDGQLCLWTEANGIVTPYLAVYGRAAER